VDKRITITIGDRKQPVDEVYLRGRATYNGSTTYTLPADPGRQIPVEVETENVDDSATITVVPEERPENATLSVTVTDAATGAPVPGATIDVANESLTSTSGAATITVTANSTYTVTGSAEGYESAASTVDVGNAETDLTIGLEAVGEEGEQNSTAESTQTDGNETGSDQADGDGSNDADDATDGNGPDETGDTDESDQTESGDGSGFLVSISLGLSAIFGLAAFGFVLKP
jgi:hypothetical protein